MARGNLSSVYFDADPLLQRRCQATLAGRYKAVQEVSRLWGQHFIITAGRDADAVFGYFPRRRSKHQLPGDDQSWLDIGRRGAEFAAAHGNFRLSARRNLASAITVSSPSYMLPNVVLAVHLLPFVLCSSILLTSLDFLGRLPLRLLASLGELLLQENNLHGAWLGITALLVGNVNR